MKRLTFNGVNDLYLHPLYGARTLENIAYMDQLARQPKPQYKPCYGWVDMSEQMSIRSERLIDEHGMGF